MDPQGPHGSVPPAAPDCPTVVPCSLSGRPADVLGVAKSLNVFRPRRYASPSAAKAEQRRKGPGETGRPPTRSAPPKSLRASPLVGGIGKR